jgi:hypothetical protein
MEPVSAVQLVTSAEARTPDLGFPPGLAPVPHPLAEPADPDAPLATSDVVVIT